MVHVVLTPLGQVDPGREWPSTGVAVARALRASSRLIEHVSVPPDQSGVLIVFGAAEAGRVRVLVEQSIAALAGAPSWRVGSAVTLNLRRIGPRTGTGATRDGRTGQLGW